MTYRKLVPISFGGVGLTTLGRRAYFEYDEGAFDTPEHSPIELGRVGRFPSHVRVQPSGKTFPLHIVVLSPDSEGQFAEIGRIFDPSNGLQTLVLENDCGDRRRVDCVPQRVIHDRNHHRPLVVPLFAPNPLLEDIAQTIDTELIDALNNPVILALRNEGNYDALPTFTAEAQVLKLAAEGYIYVQEVAYANRSEFSLTGPGSGTWLIDVTNGGLDTATEIAAARMLITGDDVAVFVDEVQVPPEKVRIADINTALTKIWIELSDAPSVNADLITAIIAGTTVFEFVDENHGFSAGDYLAWVNDAAATEQARVASVDGADVTVTRSERNTVAGASAIGITIYKSGHHIQIAWGWPAAPTRPADPDPPLIDTTASTNLQWEWLIAPIWPDNNRRPGGWRRILYDGRADIPDLRKNRLSAKVALDSDAGGAPDVRFTDIDPTAARPNFDALEFTACCGVDDVLGAIEYDASLGWPFCLQIIGRDLLGLDEVIFNRLGHETPPAHFPPRLYANQQETPASILSAVIIRARQIIVTTARPGDTHEETLEGLLTTGHDLQGFHIDEDTQIIGMVARARDVSGNAGLQLQINEVGSGAIFSAATPGAGGPGSRLAGPFAGAGALGAAFIQVCFFPSPLAAFTTAVPVLSPGDYFLSIAEVIPGAGVIHTVRSDGSIYAKGSHWEFDGVEFVREADQDLWFALLSINADNQEETLDIARTGEELTLNDITIIFDPDRTPIVTPSAVAGPYSVGVEDAYYYNTTWTLGADEIHLRFLKRWADAQNETVTIDVAGRTVVDDENGDNIRQTIEANGDPWLSLPAGANDVSVNAVNGAQGEEHVGAFRSRWQA
jgi:hypothetical protein